MIDYFFHWASETAAKQDALILANYLQDGGAQWSRSTVLPNVNVWRPSQDSTGSTGNLVHSYLTGWYAIIGWPTRAAVLLGSTALAFALDRDGPPYVIQNNVGAIIGDIACAPIFAGSHYPIGGYGV